MRSPRPDFLPTNPAALKRAFETGGRSVVDGLRNFTDDMINNGGYPRQVDTTPFKVGGNLAVTPAKVVYRNHLIELLQYEPQTDQVHEVPILCSPPWINKYYVMDLAPQRSFIEWAVQHGHTVFAISYRNPDESMADTTMDDYLIHGPRAALDVVCDITGSNTVDIVGVCLGGAMAMMTAAYLGGEGDNRIGSITLLNTLIDYSEPGSWAFTDVPTVKKLEKKMAKKGYLDGGDIGRILQLPAGERLDLQLRRLQLADGSITASLRYPRVEWRQHSHARRDALVLSTVVLRRESVDRR